MKKLVQLHWQFKDGTTDFKAQCEIGDHTEMKTFVDETQKTFPLPEGVVWLAVLEESPLFMWAAN